MIYGPGGIGKTTLACRAPGKVAYNNAEASLGILKSQFIEQGVPIPVLIPGNSFKSLMQTVKSPGWESIDTMVFEIGQVEEWAIRHTLATVKKENDTAATSIESYGYGKGFQYVYETMLTFLAELERHSREGRNIIIIAHECVKSVPNPTGEDWIRYEPKLQDPASGKASIRLRFKEWCDHVLFFGYDVSVEKDGKAKGCGTKTIYTSELPHYMAKSRTTREQINADDGTDVWAQIIK